MKLPALSFGWFCAALLLLTGCGTYHRHGATPARSLQFETAARQRWQALSREDEDKILALNPQNVSERDIRDVLSHAPAPRIINIHGGIATVIPCMVSFSEFLMGMGYPGTSITNPGDGTYTFSCYESSRKIAGSIAWYYEKESLRPMMVGHSQGGMQVVKVLHRLAGPPSKPLPVWNPITWTKEPRVEISDPVTERIRPVVGLQLPYATAMGSGGVTRCLPNQWEMCLKLRNIPDSVEEFTGFYKAGDLLGGDFLGYGSANHFKAAGHALVRNIKLPSAWHHGRVPDTRHLLKTQELMDRINAYRPVGEDLVVVEPTDQNLNPKTVNFSWAADVWYSIKRHWVLELQRAIRARRAQNHGN